MRNIELKARLSDYAAARAVALRLATAHLDPQHQLDTYFVCPHGRLKLREIDGREAQLIGYARPTTATAKGSDYELVPIPDPAALKRALAATLGVRAVVDKRREIFLWRNVRIHLDRVQGLGEFLEFEAVLGNGVDDAQGQAQVAALQTEFGLSPADLVSESYGELAGIDT